MYAIVEICGKQFRVEKDTVLDVDRMASKEGKEIKVKNVLLFCDGKNTEVGAPFLKDVEVICEVVKNLRGRKVVAFKYRRRKGYRKKIGHRQDLTRLKVKDIKLKK